jgi:hypothetical protein
MNRRLWLGARLPEWISLATAIAALLLSFVLAIRSCISAADPLMVPVEKMSLVNPASCLYPRVDENGHDHDYVQMHAELSYVNRGAPGRNSVVLSEKVTFDLGDACPYELRGFEFVELTNIKEPQLRENGTISQAFVVNAGSAVSHATLFVPDRTRTESEDPGCGDEHFNFIRWRDFFSKIEGRDHVDFIISAALYDENPLKQRCRVRVKDIYYYKALGKVCALPLYCADSELR